MRKKPSMRRDIYHITQRWARRRRVDETVLATRRLLTADPTPETVDQWMSDLRHVIGVVLTPSPYSVRYVASQDIYAQVAAKRVLRLIDTVCADTLLDQMRRARESWVA